MRIVKHIVNNAVAEGLPHEGILNDHAKLELRLKELIVASDEIIFMITGDGTLHISQRKVLAIVGLKAKKVVGRLVYNESMDYPEVLNNVQGILDGQHLKAASALGGHSYKEPYTHTLDNNGQIIDLFCLSINIAQNKRAEERLRTSKEKYNNLIESTQDAVIGFDAEGFITSWNQGAQRMLGYTRKQILGKPYSILVPEELRAKRHELLDKASKVGFVTNFETVRLSKWQKPVPVELTIIRNQKSKGGYAMAAMLRDISARKHRENELIESRSRLARAQHLSGMGSWELDLSTDTTIWSEECCRIYGLEANDNVRPYSEWLHYVHPDDRAFVEAKMESGVKKMSDTCIYHRIIRPDGAIRHIYSENKYVKGSDGELSGLYGIVRDVTEANLAEQKLRLLSAAVEQNPASIVITDPNGNINYVNAKFIEMSGRSAEEVMGKNTRILQSERSYDKAYDSMWETIVAGKAWTGEFKNKRKDGSVCWEKVSVGPIVNERGEVTDFVSVKEDITDIKATEEELRKTLLNMESIVKKRTRKLRETTEELVRINNDFMSSLEYAKRIQEAIIPSNKELDKVFNEVFTMYLPKDVISGDFYWYFSNETEVIFAMADCTGHGVPGALMSMAGHELLDSIVINKKIRKPELILEEMHKAMGYLLMRKDARFFMHDGMDMSVVHLNKKTRVFSYSGAQSHGLLIRKDSVIPLVPNRLGIGGGRSVAEVKDFTVQQFAYSPGDRFYLYSDGYYDQFGGGKGKKMMRRHFTDLLIKTSKLSMSQQHNILQQTFKDWKGNETQIDDVCVVGIRL